MAKIKILNQTEPITPDTGSTSIYVDSADKKLKYKNDAGTVGVVASEAVVEAIDQSVTVSSFRTGEDLTENDAVFLEDMVTFASAVGEGYVGYDTSTTRQAFPVIGNGETTIEVKFSLKKVGSPSADLIVRIETDNAGAPSGTLLETDSHGTVTAASLTTSLADTTVTLTGACVPTNGVKYWIVLNQAGDVVSSSNYYMYGFKAQDTTTRGPKVYGGTTWGSRVATVFPYVLGDGFHTQLLSLTDSDYSYKVDFLGFAYETKTVGQTTKVATGGIKDGFTGLTANTSYYLNATPGSIGITAGTNGVSVGVAKLTTQIDIKKYGYNRYETIGDSINTSGSTTTSRFYNKDTMLFYSYALAQDGSAGHNTYMTIDISKDNSNRTSIVGKQCVYSVSQRNNGSDMAYIPGGYYARASLTWNGTGTGTVVVVGKITMG